MKMAAPTPVDAATTVEKETLIVEIVTSNSSAEVEARRWLVAHKEQSGLSLSQLGKLTDVAGPTLSAFSGGKYAGDNDKVASRILAYRDRMAAQAAIAMDLPQAPDFYATPTSDRITQLLRWAQSGKVVLIVSSPGIGKTRTAARFAAADPNVWLATMAPSTAGVATMASEVALAVGLGEIKGSPQQLSRRIRSHIDGKNGLIIIDEAQELTDKAINELRGWHDRTGVGIALLGNDKVVGQLDTKRSAIAQISSRLSYRHVQAKPLDGDIDTALAAWGIEDAQQRDFLTRIGQLPGALREMTHTLEIALMTAFGAEEPLSIAHLRDAAKRRNVRIGAL